MSYLEEIKTIIFNYIEEEGTDYAIMVNGTWGSGKTYFWKNVIAPFITGKDKTPLYVTLYGIERKEEIDNLIALELYPFLKKKGARIAAKIAKVPLTIFKLRDLLDDFKLKDFIKLKDCVLCFDDLERNNIEIENILGYINKYVEHEGIKTLIISDEDRISGEKYKEIKEKLIGQTIEFRPESEKITESIIRYYKTDDKYYKFLTENKEIIIKVFSNSECNNVRILKLAIKSYHTIFNELRNEKDKSTMFTRDLLKFALSVAFEIKLGRANDSELKSLIKDKEGLIGFNLFATKQDGEQQKSYIEHYLDRYYNGRTNNYLSLAVYDYMLNGFFDVDTFNEELTLIENKQSDPGITKVDKLLRGYWELSDNEFKETSSDVLEKVRKGEIEYLSQYITLFQHFLVFNKEGLIPQNPEELRGIFENGLELAREQDRLKYQDSLGHLPFINEPNDEEYLYIKNVVLNSNEYLKEKEDQKKIQVLFDLLTEDFDSFIEAISSHKAGEFTLLPVFKYFQVNELYDKIVDLQNKGIVELRNAILRRYDTTNIKDYLSDDYENLLKLKAKIDNMVNNAEDKNALSIMLYRYLNKSIEEVCDKLKQN